MTDAPRVAFQGEPGAFSEEAVARVLRRGRRRPAGADVAGGLRGGRRPSGDDAGVVAIESSLAGSIRETYDLLSEFYDRGVRIVGEVSVPVRLALVALPGQSLDWIERVYSHAQALAQADEFLRSRDWQVMTTYNTAGAARMIADGRERRGGRDRVAARRRALRPRGPGRQRPERRREPDAVRRPRPRGRERGRPGRRPAAAAQDDARLRRPQRAGLAASLPRRVRRPRRQPLARSSRGRPGPPAGSTTSGSTSTPTPPTRRARRPSTTSGPRPEMVRVLGSYPARARGLSAGSGPRIETPARIASGILVAPEGGCRLTAAEGVR